MRIIIADDHPIIGIALAEMMKTFFPEADIDSVVDGHSLMLRACEAGCDYLILDLQMPGDLKSVPLLQAVHALRPEMRIVVYSGQAHPCLALASFDQGASAYVSKNSGPHVVMDAVQAVARGESFVDPAIDLQVARNHPWMRLTAAEHEILLALAKGGNLQALAIDSDRSYKTVTAHKYNALRKLGLGSNTEIGPYLSMHGLDYLLEQGTESKKERA